MAIAGTHYLIPKEPGRNSAILLAGMMHALLFLFLWVGIRWQSQEPVGVDAEIWDMSTREAAPLPEAEIPPPVPEVLPEPQVKPEQEAELKEQQEADIAIERAKTLATERKLKLKQQREELAKLEKQQQEQLQDKENKKRDQLKAALQKKAEAQAQRQHDDTVKRLTSQVVGTGGQGDAVKSTGNNRLDPSYAGKIAAKIKSNMTYIGSDNGPTNPTVEYRIDLFPDGSIRGVLHKTKSSGVSSFDEAVERAILKSAPYPADKSGEVPTTIPLTYRLKD